MVFFNSRCYGPHTWSFQDVNRAGTMPKTTKKASIHRLKVNMKYTGFLRITVWIAAGLLIEGCTPKVASLPSHHSRTNDRFIQFVERNIGIYWYGIYLEENKIGYLKSSFRRKAGQDETSYQIEISGTVHLSSQDLADKIEMDVVAEFSAQPPYSLLCYSDRTIRKNDISEVKIIHSADGYYAKITQNKETRIRLMGPFDYTLKDYTVVQNWVAQNPKPGTAIQYRHLNLETLSIQENTSRIQAIHKTIISGVRASYYDVVTKGFNGIEVQEKFGIDGRPYRIVLGGVFECRLEPESLATKMDASVDLFVKNRVPVNQPLGDPKTVALLKLKIDKNSGAMLKNASGQQVTHIPGSDSVFVTVNYKGIPEVKATAQEIKKNLAATLDIPANHSTIIGLVQNAVGDASTDSEKLSRLVKFVYKYIRDDYTANPLTVMDIIEKKKGDCSEHAKLFTAMARAMGIPCRTVGGLVYLGDEYQEFGLHAWNEVVIDGIWTPVDPTWGQTLTDASHIRFPTNISEEWQVMAAISKMKIEVLHVEHKK